MYSIVSGHQRILLTYSSHACTPTVPISKWFHQPWDPSCPPKSPSHCLFHTRKAEMSCKCAHELWRGTHILQYEGRLHQAIEHQLRIIRVDLWPTILKTYSSIDCTLCDTAAFVAWMLMFLRVQYSVRAWSNLSSHLESCPGTWHQPWLTLKSAGGRASLHKHNLPCVSMELQDNGVRFTFVYLMCLVVYDGIG